MSCITKLNYLIKLKRLKKKKVHSTAYNLNLLHSTRPINKLRVLKYIFIYIEGVSSANNYFQTLMITVPKLEPTGNRFF